MLGDPRTLPQGCTTLESKVSYSYIYHSAHRLHHKTLADLLVFFSSCVSSVHNAGGVGLGLGSYIYMYLRSTDIYREGKQTRMIGGLTLI